MQPKENLYDQKPEEPVPVIPAASSTKITSSSSSAAGSSFASRFEYFDEEQQSGGQSGTRVLSHVAPPKSSNFFNEYGMDTAFPKKSSSSSSKVQVKKRYQGQENKMISKFY